MLNSWRTVRGWKNSFCLYHGTALVGLFRDHSLQCKEINPSLTKSLWLGFPSIVPVALPTNTGLCLRCLILLFTFSINTLLNVSMLKSKAVMNSSALIVCYHVHATFYPPIVSVIEVWVILTLTPQQSCIRKDIWKNAYINFIFHACPCVCLWQFLYI